MRKIILVGTAILFLFSCKGIETVLSRDKYEFSKNATAGTINSKFLPIRDTISERGRTKNVRNAGYASLSAHFFDASKRVGISTYDINRTLHRKTDSNSIKKNKNGYYNANYYNGEVSFRPRYLAEEQPDIAYEITNTFAGQLSGSKKDNLAASLTLASGYLQTVSKLTNKSQTLNLVRTIGYRMNESAFNGDLINEEYDRIFSEVLCLTKELQIAEFESEEKKAQYQYKTYNSFKELLSTIGDMDIKIDPKVVEELIRDFMIQNKQNRENLTTDDLVEIMERSSELIDKLNKPKSENQKTDKDN